MKAKRNFFTAAVCAVYIAAVLAFAASLIFEYSGGTKRTQERFTSLTKDLSRNLKENDIGSAEFSRTILESLGNVSDIAAIQVSSDGKLLFSYPVSIDENKTASSPLIKQLSTLVKGGEKFGSSYSSPLYIKTLFYLLQRPSGFSCNSCCNTGRCP